MSTDKIEKLKTFRKKIEESTVFNKKLGELIGVDLFGYIEDDKDLKRLSGFRFDYLKNLAVDQEFIEIQDQLFEVINKTFKIISLEKVEKIQAEWNNKLLNKLNMKNQPFLTLPELCLALENKDNYYRLQYHDNSYFSPHDGEISLSTHIVPSRKQYEMVGSAFTLISSYARQKNETLCDDLKNPLKEYNDIWYKFDEKIFLVPTRLHIKDFEDFFYLCTAVYPIKGHEFTFEFNKGSLYSNDSIFKGNLSEVKNYCLVVIDDLIEEIKKNKIMATKPPSFTMNVLRPLANLIARYTSPSQVVSVAKDFGFKGVAKNPAEAETVLLQIFETLCDEQDNESIGKIIEKFLTLYGKLVDEKYHEKGLVGLAREILHHGHFRIGFHTKLKAYLVEPFEGPLHGIVMQADGTAEKDFVNQKKPKMLRILSSHSDKDDDKEYEDSQEEEQNIEISKTVTNKYKDIKFEYKNKKGRLRFKKSGKWIDLGGYNTRTFKMVKYILMPSSKSRLILDVFEYIKIKKDDGNEELQKETPRSYQLKKEIIEGCIDTLQKSEYLIGHIKKPLFNDKAKTVIIAFS